MTPPVKPDLAATLARLRERFLATSGDIVRSYETLAARLADDASDREALEELRQTTHRTHGTAGSYGFHAAARMAASLELLAIDWLADADGDRDRRARIVAGFASLLPGAFAGEPTRRLLLVDLPEHAARAVIAECLACCIAPERVPAASASTAAGEDQHVALMAPADVDVPGVATLASAGRVFVRLAPGDDPVSAVSACFGSSP